MKEIKPIIVGDTTRAIISSIFDSRIIKESSEDRMNILSRAIQIKDLKIHILNFIKRTPNAIIELTAPEYYSDKKVKIIFNNFNEDYDLSEDEDVVKFNIDVDESYTEAKITQKVSIGKDIVMILKSK